MSLVLLTNVFQYAGPGALLGLIGEGHRVVCHDASFVDPVNRAAFDAQNSLAQSLGAQTPDEIHSEVLARFGEAQALVLNDVFPISPAAIEDIPSEDFRATFEAVVMTPIRLTQLFLPAMKRRGSGAFVFVTSARETRPEPGFAVPTTLRAATTAFAKALAKEVAPFGIQANVVAPNYSTANCIILALASSTTCPVARRLRGLFLSGVWAARTRWAH